MKAQSVGENQTANPAQKRQYDYDVVVIGSGFGGSMIALTLAHKLKEKEPRILILERGTWWTTPVPTVQDAKVATYNFLRNEHKQPVQFWPSVEHFKGFIDILTRCLRRPGNERDRSGPVQIARMERDDFERAGRCNLTYSCSAGPLLLRDPVGASRPGTRSGIRTREAGC